MPVMAVLLLTALAFQNDPATFRTGVSLVHVDAEVLDATGALVHNLQKEDFRILDEGKDQPIVSFSSDLEPLDLILLFDVSGSMRAVVAAVAEASRQGLAELQKGDRVSIMVFNSRAWTIAPFSEDLEAVERSIQQDVMSLPFRGGTLIQQAVDDAALRFMKEKHTQRRRAVLIITDNIGVRTRREESVIRDFWEADAILSGLIVSNPTFEKIHTVSVVLGPQNLLMQAGMKGIAQKTGGDAIKSDDPGTAFRDSMRRIRSRYSMYYALPLAKPGSPRTIRVELSSDAAKKYPKSHIRARTGYIVPKPNS